MSGEPTKVKQFYIPAPIDGINKRAAPHQLQPTEARELINYYINDSGITEGGAFLDITDGTFGGVFTLVPYGQVSASNLLAVTENYKLLRMDGVAFGGATDITGALTITDRRWQYCFFNDYIFLFNGTDPGIIYNPAAGTAAAHGLTGPAPDADVLVQGWNYKNRLYAVQANSTLVWYGAVGAITGAMTSFDLGQVLENYGNIVFGTTWSINQGTTNEDLWVVVTTCGEVLIYSGDYPAAANWQLINRITIPVPVGNRAFVRVGQDVLIVTRLGVVSLSAVVANRESTNSYFTVSAKLGGFYNWVDCVPEKDQNKPYIYFSAFEITPGLVVHPYILVLNIERGAWSALDPDLDSYALAFAQKYATDGYCITSDGDAVKLLDNSQQSGVAHTWRTGWLNFGTNVLKKIKSLRLILRNLTGSITANNRALIGGDFTEPTTGESVRSKTLTSQTYYTEELSPQSPTAARLSVVFQKTSLSSEYNELLGADVFYQEGGGY